MSIAEVGSTIAGAPIVALARFGARHDNEMQQTRSTLAGWRGPRT